MLSDLFLIALTSIFTLSHASPARLAHRVPRKPDTIYAGTYNQQLLSFSFDSTSEKLGLVGNTSFLAPFNNAAPSWLEPSHSARGQPHKFYISDESGAGQIQLLKGCGATVELLATTSSGGNGPAFIGTTSDGKWIFGANYGDGTLLPVPLNADGTFGTPLQSVFNFNGDGVSHPHQTVELPNGSILINDLGRDLLHEISLGEDGLWKLVGETTVEPKGAGPRHGVLSNDGSVYYLVTEEANLLQIFTVDYTTVPTTFTHVSSTSILPPNAVPYDGFILGAGELLKSKDGKFLYVTNRNENNTLGDTIVTFEITTPTTLGDPTFVRTSGQHIRGVQFDAKDEYLIGANMLKSPYAPPSVFVFSRNATSGQLTKVDSLDLPDAISVTGFIWDP